MSGHVLMNSVFLYWGRCESVNRTERCFNLRAILKIGWRDNLLRVRQRINRQSGLAKRIVGGCEMNFGVDLTGRILRLLKQLVGFLPMRDGLCKSTSGSEMLC